MTLRATWARTMSLEKGPKGTTLKWILHYIEIIACLMTFPHLGVLDSVEKLNTSGTRSVFSNKVPYLSLVWKA